MQARFRNKLAHQREQCSAAPRIDFIQQNISGIISWRFLILLVLLSLPLAAALTILAPQENATYNDTTIAVTYLTSGSTCHASAESATGGGPLLIPDIAACHDFTYNASWGWNSLILSDGQETRSVSFYVGARPESPTPPINNTNSISNNSTNDSTVVTPTNPSATGSPSDEETQTVPDETAAPEDVQDQPDPLGQLFTERSVSQGAVTADSLHYDYPPGVAFIAYVKVRNIGTDPAVTFVATALHGSIISVRRLDAIPSTVPVTLADGRQRSVRRYDVQERKLGLRQEVDQRIGRIADSRHRSPPWARGASADDTIAPGGEAVYAVTLRAPAAPQDEFWFQAVSSDMAEGLDPFVNANWSYVRNITLSETYGVARTGQLVYMNLTGFATEQLNNCTKEIRVSNDTYDDVPVRVVGDGGNLSSGKWCAIEFGASIPANANETFYVYYGNPDATAPAAATNTNLLFNLTWTPSAVYFPTVDLGTTGDNTDNIAPTVLDYDCDGAVDLVYGIDSGQVYWRHNTGTNASPAWAAAVQILAATGTFSSPEFALLFGGNSVLDLVVGNNTGHLRYYENTGTCGTPAWTLRTVMNGTYDYGSNAKAAQGDFNGDGLIDLMVGNDTGHTSSAENYNTTTYPAFWIDTIAVPADAGNNNAPSTADLNFDGLLDLVMGLQGGTIRVFYNNGTRTAPSWFNAGLQQFNVTSGNIDVGSYAAPSMHDMNGDGWEDLVMGDVIGYITAYNSNLSGYQGMYLINAPLNASPLAKNKKPSVAVSITPPSPFRNDTLNCSANITDDESGVIAVNFTWSRDGVLNASLNQTRNCTNSTVCYYNVTIGPGNLTPNDVWSCTVTAYDTPWTPEGSANATVQNRLPSINVTAPLASITLTAGGRTSITCNASITDPDNTSTINSTNATIYLNGTSAAAPDSNVSHYTNASCTTTGSSTTTLNITCGFTLLYYASNGTWWCNVTVNDTWNVTSNATTFSIDPLFALNITPITLDFGTVAVGSISANRSVNISNIGNQAMNVSAYGYGSVPGDGNSFACSPLNLSVTLLRFSKSVSANYTQKLSLSSSPQPLNLTITAQNDSNPDLNESYWQMSVPQLFADIGQCNGTLVFQAEAP
jgi:hypothetical protein